MIRSTSSIDSLNLSTRSRNALHRAGINTVGDLVQLNEEDILKIKYLGRKSLEELTQLIPNVRNTLSGDDLSEELVNADADEWTETEAGRNAIITYLQNKGVSIDALDAISAKAYNLLAFNDFEELYQVIFLSENDLLAIPHMDIDTAKEIFRNTQHYIRQNKDLFSSVYHALRQENKTIEDYFNDPALKEKILQFVKTNDISIDDLNLSVRALNCLHRAGLLHMSDIVFMTVMQLKEIPSMGNQTASQITDRIRNYKINNKERIIAFCNGDETVNYTDRIICSRIIDLYNKAAFVGFSFKEIYEHAGFAGNVSEERVKKNIGTMIAEHYLEYVDYRCYRVYTKFSDYCKQYQYSNERNYDFINLRLQGKTLEEISASCGITRERVRQIISKEYKKIRQAYIAETGTEYFDEDYYRYFLETYVVSKSDCETYLGIPAETFNFIRLSGKSSKRTEQLESATDDPKLDTGLRIRIEKYLNKDKLFINGVYVRKNRSAVENILIPIICKETISYSEFVKKYNQTLKENNISIDSDVYYTEEVIHSRGNRLADSKILLWTKNERMRYYDIEARDYTELLDTINLDAYENTGISTGKFMEYYPLIMEKYDIHNHLELHNLLRKIIPEGSYHEFKCSRMPNIQFGKFDREAAFFDMMVENAPISGKDLAQLIHDEYGYEIASVMASPEMVKLSPYYHKGIYSIDQKVLSQERADKLLSSLTDDFYYIDEIRAIYQNLFSDAEADEINPYSLKGLGFLVYSKVVLRNHAGLESYYKYLLLKEDVFDVTEYKRRFSFTCQFSEILNELKRTHLIFEFAPNQFVHIRRLEKAGYSKDDIEEFLEDVYNHAEEQTYFNSHSLRNSGFHHALYDLGFEDAFYTNLICTDPRYSFTKIFNSAVLYKGTKNLTIQSFLQDLVSEQGSVDIYDLEDDLRDTYGLVVSDRLKLIYKLQNTPVYYDRILERFYKTKDLYYQELDESEGLQYAG